MIDTRSHGGTMVRFDDRARSSSTHLEAIQHRLEGITHGAMLEDFDLATLITQVPAPLTAINLDACRLAYQGQLGLVLIEVEALQMAVGAAVLAYEQAEKGISEVFGGLFDFLGYASGRMFAISLPVLIPVGLAVGIPIYAGLKLLDATGLDDVIARQFGINIGQAKSDLKEAFVALVFENSDVTGAVIEHVMPGFVLGFMGLPPGLLDTDADHSYWPHDSSSMTAWVLAGANKFGLLLPSDVEVWKAKGLTAPHEKPPQDIEELFVREANCHRGADSGQVRIEEVKSPDGTSRFIVYVPATTDWSPQPGDNTTDITTNVEGMAGNDTVMREMVRQAIADAGIDPDDEVMLVGYSQGGITAGSLAGDQDFLKDVNVTALLTVGAPISDFPIDDSVEVLSIEHEQDLVPDLDGNENPGRDNWSTVTVDFDPDELRKAPSLKDKTDAELDAMFASAGSAHSSPAYTASIGLLVRAGHPDVQRFTKNNSRFFNGAITETRDYQGKRKRT